MKIKENFMLKEIAGSFVVVPTGAALVDFQMMLSLNETGVFLWEHLKTDTNEEKLLEALLKEYDVDEATAKADINEFVELLKTKKVIEE